MGSNTRRAAIVFSVLLIRSYNGGGKHLEGTRDSVSSAGIEYFIPVDKAD